MHAIRPRPRPHPILTVLVVLGLTLMNLWQPGARGVAGGYAAATGAPATGHPVEADETSMGLTAGARQRMLEQIERDHYRFVQQKLSSSTSPVYQAANSNQDWRLTGSGAGVEVALRGCGEACEGEAGQWRLVVTGYGYGDKLEPVWDRPQMSLTEQNRLLYRWDDNLSEWYVHERHGLKQNFRLAHPPAPQRSTRRLAGRSSSLVVEMALFTSLAPQVAASGQAITFQNAQGAHVLHYAGLRVYDAAGRILPAHLQVAAPAGAFEPPYRVRIVVEDAGAVYPVTIDPLLFREEAKLTASDAQAGDHFGLSVALSGDTALVGACCGGRATDPLYRAGAAYIFERNAGGADNWGQVQKLTSSDLQGG